MNRTLRLLVLVLTLVAAWLVAGVSRAAPGHGGRIVLSVPGRAAGPLVLEPGQGGWVGTLVVTNVGTEPLGISRVGIRGDEDDVRSPAHVGVRFLEGPATSATLAPGASRELSVTWMPDKDPRVKQAFGHVVVTSTDEQAGEVAMGFRADLPTGLGGLGRHALSLLLVLPLLVVLAAFGSRLAGRRDERWVQGLSLGTAAAQVVVALWVFARFAPDVGKADGNDGFQWIERSVWIRSLGAEWYLGVDGVSVALVPLAALLWLVAIVAAPPERRTAAYHASLALLASAVAGVLVALDLTVLFGAWQLVLVALVTLIGGWGGPRGEHAAARLAVYGALGTVAMLALFAALSRASGPTFLVDGAPAPHTLSIPELARTSFAARGTLLGLPFAEGAWLMLLVAVAAATPIVPLHGWLPEALEEAPGGAAILLVGAVTGLGPYLLMRVGLGALPEGARWVGSSLAALGVLTVAYAGLCAMAARDLRRFLAYATIASAGAALFGVAAFTAQGLAGATMVLVARGLGGALLAAVASMLERRLGTTRLAHLGGLTSEVPGLAALLAIGLATSLGVPCLAGLWGPLLALLGGFGKHPVLALLLAAAVVTSAVAHLRVARMTLLGTFDEAWRTSVALSTFRGRLPDLSRRERSALVPLVVLAVLLGLWPTPILSAIAAGVRDMSAVVEPADTP